MEFTDKQQVFFNKYIGKYDTPKKLNRSSKDVNGDFIDLLEDGTVTSRDILKQSQIVPIFTYKTCVTIHGNIPPVKISRIGGYKNIIQNANGSIEVRYSAIDNDLKAELGSYLKDYSSQKNSTNGYYFERTIRTQVREDAIKEIKAQSDFVETFVCDGFKAKMFVSGLNVFGMYYVITTIIPLVIDTDISVIACDITGKSIDEINAVIAEQKAEKERRDKECQERIVRQNELKEKRAELQKVEFSRLLDNGYIVATSFDNTKTYLTVAINEQLKPLIQQYIDSKFNNLLVSVNGGEFKKSIKRKSELKENIAKGTVLIKR